LEGEKRGFKPLELTRLGVLVSAVTLLLMKVLEDSMLFLLVANGESER
jgi:hypothetical protein